MGFTNRHSLALSHGLTVGRHPGALRASYDPLQPLRALAQGRGLGPPSRGDHQGLRRRYRDDRQLLCPGPSPWRRGKEGDQDDGCMGRSRGGLTTKIHALVDAEGRPVRLELSAGQAHDSTEAEGLLEPLGEGAILLAAERGAWADIPAKSNRKDDFLFSRWIYRQRNLVGRFFNTLKQFRGIAIRYDKNPLNLLAAVKLASIRIWPKTCESTT